MLPEKNDSNLKNTNRPLNYDNDLMNKVLKDLERDFNNQNDYKLPSTITSIKKKVNSNQNNTEGVTSKKVSDVDLLTSMTKRLNIVERQLSDEKKTSKKNDSRIHQLLAENKKLKEELNTRETQSLIKEYDCINCNKLKNYIIILTKYTEELREFIKEKGFIILNALPAINGIDDDLNNDYANKIINNKTEKNSKDENENEDDEYSTILPKEIDIEVLSRRIEELNMLIIKDGHISKFEMDEDKIFKLKRQKELKIFFYNNGIMIETYKFYEYNSIEAKRILHDILDGYTPYILKNNYPNGVLLYPVNNLHQGYNPKNLNNSHNHLVKLLNEPTSSKEKISGEEFLKKFPEKIIKDGKIYNIREDIEKLLVNKRDNEYNLDASEYYLNFQVEEVNSVQNLICKLKIKIVSVDRIITINVLKNDKMKSVFDFLKKFLNSTSDKLQIEKFCLYSTFPFKVYNYQDDRTIEENGLYPSYFLIFELDEKFSEKKK